MPYPVSPHVFNKLSSQIFSRFQIFKSWKEKLEYVANYSIPISASVALQLFQRESFIVTKFLIYFDQKTSKTDEFQCDYTTIYKKKRFIILFSICMFFICSLLQVYIPLFRTNKRDNKEDLRSFWK